MNWLEQVRPKLIWLWLLPLIFIPRWLNPARFLTADEPLFLSQARHFAAGLVGGDLSQTLGIGYPGVTLAWWSSPWVSLFSQDLAAYAAGRLATATVTGLLLLLLFALARRLFGQPAALVGIGLLALDPFSLAYNRLLHIAGPLALFMSLAGLAFLLWLKEEWRGWLALTGLFTGLALLTKSTALLLGPMLLASMAGWFVAGPTWPGRRGWPGIVRGLLGMGLLAGLVFFLGWPAMWYDPAQALNLTFGKLFTDQEAGAGNLGLFWLGRFVEDPGPLFYPVAFVLKATPWLLLGLGLSVWFLKSERQVSLPLWLFALTYLGLMTIASKKSIRYMLPAFPIFYLLAGLALARLAAGWSKKGVVSLFAVAIATATFYHPYYFTYYNPLLLGWRWAPRTLLVGWGEGLDQAAAYLNQQPPAPTAAWYEWLFPLFYHGPVEAVVPQERLISSDHVVLYVNQVQRDIPSPNIIHYFRTRRQAEHTVRLAGIDYAWVYPGPIAGLNRPDPTPGVALGGDFGGEARLLGYDLPPEPRSGQPLIVTLYWRVLAQPVAERFVYLRLVDERGQIWASADSPPVMGLWPVDRWQPGMLIEDAHELTLPAGTPPGPYRLEVGLYEPGSGQVLVASGQPLGQGGGLLLGPVAVTWQAQTNPSDLARPVELRLAPNAQLIAYDPPPGEAVNGDLLPIHLTWREAGSLLSAWFELDNDWVLFEWRDGSGQTRAEQMEPLPLPLAGWGRGAVLRSQHQVIVPPGLSPGRYSLWLMLHTGSDPAGPPFQLGPVAVTSPPRTFSRPATATPLRGLRLDQDIALVGYELAPVAPTVTVTLYWQSGTALTRPYKVFAQLLAAGNQVVAQSDQWPGAGSRPTTGWLPQEIISDSHTLTIPPGAPPGPYRLIAGLYDPFSGQRLPLEDGSGDFLSLPEVNWP